MNSSTDPQALPVSPSRRASRDARRVNRLCRGRAALRRRRLCWLPVNVIAAVLTVSALAWLVALFVGTIVAVYGAPAVAALPAVLMVVLPLQWDAPPPVASSSDVDKASRLALELARTPQGRVALFAANPELATHGSAFAQVAGRLSLEDLGPTRLETSAMLQPHRFGDPLDVVLNRFASPQADRVVEALRPRAGVAARDELACDVLAVLDFFDHRGPGAVALFDATVGDIVPVHGDVHWTLSVLSQGLRALEAVPGAVDVACGLAADWDQGFTDLVDTATATCALPV